MAAVGLGATVEVELPSYGPVPKPKGIAVKDAIPKGKDKDEDVLQGWTNAASCFLVSGTGFSKDAIIGGNVGGRDCSVEVLSETLAMVTCDAWGIGTEPKQVDLYFVTKKGWLPVGRVDFSQTYNAGTPSPTLHVARDKNGAITGLTIEGDYDRAKQLLEQVRAALAHDTATDIKVELKAASAQ